MIDMPMGYEHGIDLRMLPRPLIDEVCFANRLQFQGGPEQTLP
jgi:hypothetical protein